MAEPGGDDDAARTVLEERLGHRFDDPVLFVLALQHRSWCAEHPGSLSNERLEFLGDAVLSVVVTDHIYNAYPHLPEGELAKLRAAVVSSEALADAGAELGLGPALRLGKGEESTGGRQKASILADTTEAVIGALYLDGGIEPARNLIFALLSSRIERAAEDPGTEDYKTRLQERIAQRFDTSPRYELTHDGPDHKRHYYAAVYVGDDELGRGEGRSKKLAEQAAARAAWDALDLTVGPIDHQNEESMENA